MLQPLTEAQTAKTLFTSRTAPGYPSASLLPARRTRTLKRAEMWLNDACPRVTVNPQTFDVFVDGELATCEPAKVLPLAQRYYAAVTDLTSDLHYG